MISSTSWSLAKQRIPCIILSFLLLCSIIAMGSHDASAREQKSRYATLRYTNSSVLKKFNETLYLGRSLRRAMNKKNTVTTEDEVLAKLDTIIEKAMVVLDMYPNHMHITFVIATDRGEVAKIFYRKYGKRANHIAYYSLSEDTIYVAADRGNLEVVSHEIGHAIVDHFFEVRPPYNIHELMAQFTSKHIND